MDTWRVQLMERVKTHAAGNCAFLVYTCGTTGNRTAAAIFGFVGLLRASPLHCSALGLRLDKRSALGLTGIVLCCGEVAGWDGAGPPKGCMLSDDNLTWTCQSMLAHLRTCGCGTALLTHAMHCGTRWHVAYITQRAT